MKIPTMFGLRSGLVGLVALVLTNPAPAHAQDAGALMTRTELEQLLERRLAESESPAYAMSVRRRALEEASRIRTRLSQGDLQVGDRVALNVVGQPALQDTFPVTVGRVLDLPVVGAVDLAGVLRSEMTEHLTSHIARFVRDPVVNVQTLIRTAVLGGVNRPNFYALPSDYLLEDALRTAGGPAAQAKINEIRIERAGESIASGEELSEAMRMGLTLDQLDVRAGDQIIVPLGGTRGGAETTLRTVSVALSIPLAIFAVIQLF